jgi:hypothetical protein
MFSISELSLLSCKTMVFIKISGFGSVWQDPFSSASSRLALMLALSNSGFSRSIFGGNSAKVLLGGDAVSHDVYVLNMCRLYVENNVLIRHITKNTLKTQG